MEFIVWENLFRLRCYQITQRLLISKLEIIVSLYRFKGDLDGMCRIKLSNISTISLMSVPGRKYWNCWCRASDATSYHITSSLSNNNNTQVASGLSKYNLNVVNSNYMMISFHYVTLKIWRERWLDSGYTSSCSDFCCVCHHYVWLKEKFSLSCTEFYWDKKLGCCGLILSL